MSDGPSSLHLFSPAGVLRTVAPLVRAARRLGALGFAVTVDPAAGVKAQRFAGDDETRLAAIHRVAAARPSVALASRGGYGLTRLLDRIDWKRIGKSVDAGTRWVGMSDLTSLQLGLLAHAGGGVTWAGPLACEDFGRSEAEGGVDDVTQAASSRRCPGSSRRWAFAPTPASTAWRRAARSGAAISASSIRCSARRTSRTSRAASCSSRTSTSIPTGSSATCCSCSRRACSTGSARSSSAPSPPGRSRRTTGLFDGRGDRRIRAATRTPILGGLPFGHVPTKVTMPVGAKVQLLVDGRDAFIGW
jgi:muramoyltetrapeptide carboxypeptidase